MIFIKSLLPIGILLSSLGVLPTYTRLSKEHSFRLLVFSQYEINWTKKDINGLLLANGTWQRKTCPFPTVIYNRVYAQADPVVERLTKHIGKEKIFNLITHFDKWHIYRALLTSPVNAYLPRSYLYQQEDLPDLINHHKNIILKPRKGNQGLGIWHIQLQENGQYALYHDYDFPALLNNNQLTLLVINYLTDPNLYLAQEYIEFQTLNNQHFDIRILVQKDERGEWRVSATLSRIAKKNYFITNISNKSLDSFTLLNQLKLPAVSIMKTIYKLSIATASALEQALGHLGEISVDFGLDENNKPWIIEVNGKPNKELFKELGSKELIEKIYLQPVCYSQYLAK